MMPTINFKWEVSPATILMLLQLLGIMTAIYGGFIKLRDDQSSNLQTVAKLESIITAIRSSQDLQGNRITRVEAKVDIILPMIQNISQRLPPSAFSPRSLYGKP